MQKTGFFWQNLRFCFDEWSFFLSNLNFFSDLLEVNLFLPQCLSKNCDIFFDLPEKPKKIINLLKKCNFKWKTFRTYNKTLFFKFIELFKNFLGAVFFASQVSAGLENTNILENYCCWNILSFR